MRYLFAWVSSFTRNDHVVNQAVRQLTEIARERVNSSAGNRPLAQADGYQRARLRQMVREYLDALEKEDLDVSTARRQPLVEKILERLVEQDLIQTEPEVAALRLPRKAA
ncbi:hypothetical protein [Bremerella alba]|uniref:Uncharacterized protein n=1 Tax=Bremerella alba TaxID=980252 RepID=A0A7V8V4Q3_9BACT|nr:hypothetical protein [Bremerella alba]MBA2114897.1 hypothetical protein [Bremerella alba]